MIVCSVCRGREKMALAEIERASELADIVELRLDGLSRDPDVKKLLGAAKKPVIATCRRLQDGGKFNGSEEKRLLLLRQAVLEGVDYVDLELDVADQVPPFGKTKRIISYHNFKETPANLKDIYAECAGKQPDVIKIVTRAADATDNLRMFRLLSEQKSVPLTAFCLGEIGICSRILGRKFGMAMTYSYLGMGLPVAPGQLKIDEFIDVYRYRDIDEQTEVYGVIGNPIGHSLSPHIHNAALKELGLNAVYVPFQVEDLGAFLEAFELLGIKGYSVTIPHKEVALRLLRQADKSVQATKACNTLVKEADGWTGYNTDVPALRETLEKGLGGPVDGKSPLAGKQVTILGAGGVARAACQVCQEAGALVTICNRTLERGQRLASEFDCRCQPMEALYDTLTQVLINCTSVGMSPEVDQTPLHLSYLTHSMAVFDTIYNPPITKLLEETKRRGGTTIAGVEMFIKQAAMQFQLFTGHPAPVPVMARVVHERLGLR